MVEGVKYYQLAGSAHYVREENVQIGDLEAEAGTARETADGLIGDYGSVNEVGVKFSDDLGKAIEKSGGEPSDEMGKSADSFNILGGLAQFAGAITSEKKVRSFSLCGVCPKIRPECRSTRADSRKSHRRTKPLLLL